MTARGADGERAGTDGSWVPAPGGGPHRVRDLLAAGLTEGRLRWMVRTGEARRVRRGLLELAPGGEERLERDPRGETRGGAPHECRDGAAPGRPAGPDAVDKDLVRAVLDARPPGTVVSHETAARLHGLGLWRAGDRRVQVIVPGEPNRRYGDVVIRGTSIDAANTTTLDGIPVTDLARTAVDCARGRPLREALVPLDSAARLLVAARLGEAGPRLRDAVQHPASRWWARTELERAAGSVAGWPGSRVVRAALPLVHPAAESPFESWSRGVLIEAAIEVPEVGMRIVGRSGQVYFADMCWPRQRCVGEADGWGKYGASTAQFRQRLTAERRRQQDIEAAGWRVVRWSSDEPRAVISTRVAVALDSSPAHRRSA